MASTKPASLEAMIADIEALLIKSKTLKNVNSMNFAQAKRWDQIPRDEIDKFYERL